MPTLFSLNPFERYYMVILIKKRVNEIEIETKEEHGRREEENLFFLKAYTLTS